MDLSKGYMVMGWAPETDILGIHDTYEEAVAHRNSLLKELLLDWVTIIEVTHETKGVTSLIKEVYVD